MKNSIVILSLLVVVTWFNACIFDKGEADVNTSHWMYQGPKMGFDQITDLPFVEVSPKTKKDLFTLNNISNAFTPKVGGEHVYANYKKYDLTGKLEDSSVWVYPYDRQFLNGQIREFNIYADGENVQIILNGGNSSVFINSETDTLVGRSFNIDPGSLYPTKIYYNSTRKSIVMLELVHGKSTATKVLGTYINRMEFSIVDGKVLKMDQTMVYKALNVEGPGVGGTYSRIFGGKVEVVGDHLYLIGGVGYSSCCYSIAGSHDGDIYGKGQGSFAFLKLKESDFSEVWFKEYRYQHLTDNPQPNVPESNQLDYFVVDKEGSIYGLAETDSDVPEGVRGSLAIFKLNSSGEKVWSKRLLGEKLQSSNPQSIGFWISPTGELYFSYSLYFADPTPWLVNMATDGSFKWVTKLDNSIHNIGFTSSGKLVFPVVVGLTLTVYSLE